jgi:hypothetical protein
MELNAICVCYRTVLFVLQYIDARIVPLAISLILPLNYASLRYAAMVADKELNNATTVIE